ncbi:MAG TPA: sigma factor-like helix-turn-helix DNA-binding protein [Nocardioidaceae bacterium]|nr:sigma factor-like helix-turn-helix DNA-binding protein [Nocardioidaceae bacterium]
MGREEQFDSFYLATRRALVMQTFALTGDLSAAQGAVRDAYTAAWHHWRKASAHEDPLDWVRPRAWQLAQRRHTARLRQRTKGLRPETQDVLDAIAKLPASQRRVILLTQLAGVPLDKAARELNTTEEQAERNLRAAAAGVAAALDIGSAAIREHLLELDAAIADARLPRASIIRRAGVKRRRSHTAIAAFTAAFLTVAAGAFAHEPRTGSEPEARMIRQPAPATSDSAPAESKLPSTDDLLNRRAIAGLGPAQSWRVEETHDNTDGNGINSICQQSRFADPDGLSAMVREFRAKGRPSRTATQTIEISRTPEQAETAYQTVVGWFAGCQEARLQLLRAYDVSGVGDRASVMFVRVWEEPVTTYSVAVSQVGQVVTSTIGTTVAGQTAGVDRVARVLAESVAPMCAQDGEEKCAAAPKASAVPPPVAGSEEGLLAVVDLPPVGAVNEPWVGTTAQTAKQNPAETTCDRADFSRGAKRAMTRTYLIPGARLPTRFGLSETVGEFRSEEAATRFLSNIRAKVAGCEDRDLATEVVDAGDLGGGRSGSVWQLSTEISDAETVRFTMGFIRVGNKVAQLTFAPADDADMSLTDFRALLVRAGERLGELG